MVEAVGTVQIDNARTRVTEWRFSPEGSESLAELKADISCFREKGVHHNVINANDFEFSFVEVEIK